MDNKLGILQGVSLSHPSTSLDKKYENLNNNTLYFNKNKNNSKQYTKNNNSIKTLSKLKKSSIPLKRSNSSSQLFLQSTKNKTILEKKRASSAKTNRNKTSSNYVFQTPWEPNEIKSKLSKNIIQNNFIDETDNSITLDFNISEEDLIKNESMPFLNSDFQNFNPNEITFPENLNEEWNKIKQNKDIVSKIENLSKLLFSDYDKDTSSLSSQLQLENDSNELHSQSIHEKNENIILNDINNENNNVNLLVNVNSNSELNLMDALQPNSINGKNDALFKFPSNNENENNQIIDDKIEDNIYNHSSLKETEMTIKQLDYLINNQKLNNENSDISNTNFTDNQSNTFVSDIINNNNIDFDIDIWNKLSPSFIKHLNHCAEVIQRWYRFQSKRKKILNNKKREILSSLDIHNHITGKNTTDLITQDINIKENDSNTKSKINKIEEKKEFKKIENKNIDTKINININKNQINNNNNNIDIDIIKENNINKEDIKNEDINYDNDYESEFEEYEGDENGNDSLIKIENNEGDENGNDSLIKIDENNERDENGNDSLIKIDENNERDENGNDSLIKIDENNERDEYGDNSLIKTEEKNERNENGDDNLIKIEKNKENDSNKVIDANMNEKNNKTSKNCQNQETTYNDIENKSNTIHHDNFNVNNNLETSLSINNKEDNNKNIDSSGEKHENLKKIVIKDNKENIKSEYSGNFISNIDQISVVESDIVSEVELDDVINRLKCSDRNVSNQKIVINGTIGLNIEECGIPKIDEETVKSESSINDKKNEAKDKKQNNSLTNVSMNNNKYHIEQEDVLLNNSNNKFNYSKNNTIENGNSNADFDDSNKKEILPDKKTNSNYDGLRADEQKSTSRPQSASRSSIIETLKELRNINKSFKKLKEDNDIESLISLEDLNNLNKSKESDNTIKSVAEKSNKVDTSIKIDDEENKKNNILQKKDVALNNIPITQEIGNMSNKDNFKLNNNISAEGLVLKKENDNNNSLKNYNNTKDELLLTEKEEIKNENDLFNSKDTEIVFDNKLNKEKDVSLEDTDEKDQNNTNYPTTNDNIKNNINNTNKDITIFNKEDTLPMKEELMEIGNNNKTNKKNEDQSNKNNNNDDDNDNNIINGNNNDDDNNDNDNDNNGNGNDNINKSHSESIDKTLINNNSKLLLSPQKKSNINNATKLTTNKLKNSLKLTKNGKIASPLMEKNGKKIEKEASSLKPLSKETQTKQYFIEKEIKKKIVGRVDSNIKGKLEKTAGNNIPLSTATHSSGTLNKRLKASTLKSSIDIKHKENTANTKESQQNISTPSSANKIFTKKDLLRKRIYNEKLKSTSFIKSLSKDTTPTKKGDIKSDIKNKVDHTLHKSNLTNGIKKENNLIKIPNDRLSPSNSMISKVSDSPKKKTTTNKKEATVNLKQETTKSVNSNNDPKKIKKEKDKKIEEKTKTIEEINTKISVLENKINQLEECESIIGNKEHNKEFDQHKKRKEKEKGKSTEIISNIRNSLDKKEDIGKEKLIEKTKEEQLQNQIFSNNTQKNEISSSISQKTKISGSNEPYVFTDNTTKDEKMDINFDKKDGMMIKSESTEYNISNKDKIILDSYKNLGKPSSMNNNSDNNNNNNGSGRIPGSPIKSLNSDVVFPSLVDNQGKKIHDNLIQSKIIDDAQLSDEDKIFNKISTITSSLDYKNDSLTKITNDFTIGVNGHLNLINSNGNNSTSDDLNHFSSNSPTVTATADQTSKRIDRILDYLKSVGNNSFEMLSETITDKSSVKSDFDLMDSVSKYNGSTVGTMINSRMSDTESIYSLYNKDKKDNTVEVFDGVKSKIITQQMEIEEKTRSLDFLKKELKKLKDTLKDQTVQYRKDIKSKLSLQRKEYETIIKRHLSFVDKLLGEKEQLTTKCQNLGDEVKNMEKMYKHKIKELEEHHTRDIKQQKELWQASEKLRRDKWIQTKEKQIKDNTIKGLEPEIQKMLSQHKLQIKQLEESYQEKLIKEKQLILDQHQHQMEQLRDKISSERQRACEEEREFSRQRYMKQLERDEMEFQQNKRKLIMEMEEEKTIIVNQLKQEKKKEEEKLLKEIDELKKRISDIKTKNEESISELNRKNIKEINNIKEKMEIEKQEWQNLMIQKNEKELHQKEKIIKEKYMSERDAEIEMVIQRLESETNSSTSDITRQHRIEIEKLKAENADEIKKLRDEHNLSLDKIIEIQEKMKSIENEKRQIQKELIRSQHESTIMEQQLQSQKQELNRLKVSKDALSDMIREEFKSQLELSKSNIEILNEQLNSQKAQTELLKKKNQQDIENINKEKEMALQLVEEKVHQALATKDEIILKLKENIDELTLRNKYLEGMIEKQRIELLS
ncbi:hypothetical protein BCR36DRAFT_584197 [Piromyces finnis]|uniref:Centrosomal protein of 131 kDa n=1 Tax=Piromyces finnis TaxID=1754191 RepID=A0A1Y1V708_9FUNG|nr:hypothetical protein BCR36DRAFT_584197 [Piromyces finnis]|eukprot:ORX48635.1 hypothetical protein BCR36DRAFT_584197 [Piromyces finnis]